MQSGWRGRAVRCSDHPDPAPRLRRVGATRLNATFGIATTLALYVALRWISESLMAIALALGFMEAVTLIVARPAFEILYLSEQHTAATTDAQRALFLAAGETVLATFHSTAFQVGYNLFSVHLLMVSLVMLRSQIFGRITACAGILAAILNWGLYMPGSGILLSGL
jgi:hypothetical protein